MTLAWDTVFPLPVVAFIAVTWGFLGAAYGASRGYRDTEERYRHLIASDASIRTAIRALYDAEGYEPPDFWPEGEPEPEPRWWQRLSAWYWRPGPVEPHADPVEPHADEWDEADYQRQAAVDRARLDEAIRARTTPDPSPPTNPIRMPADTQPAHAAITPQAVVGDQWAERSAAIRAEFEAKLAELEAGR